jgi:hypothetical protein
MKLKTRPLSACLRSIESAEGRERLAAHLKSLPYPHYEPAPGSSGLLVKIEANGKRTTGRFVNRKSLASLEPGLIPRKRDVRWKMGS